MEKTVNQLVDRWFDIVGHDGEDKPIRLYYDNYRNKAAEANRLLSRMRKEYSSDILTFCVLRFALEAHLDIRLPVRDAMSDGFRNLVSFYDEVSESPHNSKVTEFRLALERFIARPNLIGEQTDDFVCRSIAEVGPLQGIGYECLRSSGRPLSPVTSVAKDLIIAHSLGELLLKTASMPDGMVLGYVVREKDNEGFFSLMIKSNGNIVSANDRPVEKYFGQFGILSRRNDRHTEDKAFSVFPYESVLEITFREDGVHDIIDSAKVRGESLSFDDFTVDEAVRFFVGCMLITSRLSGRTWEDSQTLLTTSLFRDNLPLLESKALVNVQNRQVTEQYSAMEIRIPDHEIVRPPLEGRNSDDTFYGRNLSPVLFSEWFRPEMAELREDYNDIMPDLRRRFPGEFVATEADLKKALVLHLRKGIRDKVQEAINTYYHEHGDGDEGLAAYRKIFLERKDRVLENLRPVLSDPERWEKQKLEVSVLTTGRFGTEAKTQKFDGFLPFNDPDLVDYKGSSGYYKHGYLKDGKGLCTMVFKWSPRDITEICSALGVTAQDLPREMAGWSLERNHGYGNSLLSVTDPCEEIQNGYTASGLFGRWNNPFGFTIAMSKRAWNAAFGKKEEGNADDM